MGEVTRSGDEVLVSVHPPRRHERLLYGFVRGAIVVFAKLFWRLDVRGAEHIPADRPFVLAPVHRSNVDFALVSTVVRRRMRYLGKDTLWKAPRAFGWFISTLGAFPVRRGSADRAALRTCTEVIGHGEPLVMFPEGTRQQGPVVQELFDGPAYVAARTGVALVPVGIGGSALAMPKGSKLLRPVKICVEIGAPMWPTTAGGGRASRREVRELTERLHVEVQRLFDVAQERAGNSNPP
ncbi:lysophospholipid acyltransferase family protein [soil metagenome]